jgi:hypothetical protein
MFDIKVKIKNINDIIVLEKINLDEAKVKNN